MPYARNGAVRLYYEAHGEPGKPTFLLMNGAGRQCIDYPDAFCGLLLERGFGVLRYDQRDTGRSTDFTYIRPDAAGVAAALAEGLAPTLPYTVADLAGDALAVLDAASVHSAHLFARSLSSLSALSIALNQPARVVSMTLVMAMCRSIGGEVAPERLERLDAEFFSTVEAYVARQVESARALGNPDYYDEARIRAEAAHAYERGVHHGAIARHFMVGLGAPDFRSRLGELRLPVQVIHGRRDKVIPLARAEETAQGIAGARLDILDDMAHEGPPQLWSRWVDLAAANAARAITR